MSQRLEPKTIRAWLLVLVWAAIVWNLGGDGFSQSQTSRFLGPLVRWIFPQITHLEVMQLQLFVRKFAHLFEYGLLAILTLRALLVGRGPSLATSAGLTMAIVVTFASADETRQGFSAQRGGSGWDVLLDSLGAAVAIALLWFVRLRFGDSAQRRAAGPGATPDQPGGF